MTFSKIASLRLLLLVGYWLSSQVSVRAEDEPFGALVDQLYDRHSDGEGRAQESEAEVRPFPKNLSLGIGGGQRVAGQSLAQRFGISGLYTAERENRPEVPVIWASPAVDKLQRSLAQPLKKEGFKFTDTPLSEVADFVRKEYGLKVLLDLPSLDELGLSPDDTLDANLSGISLGAALKVTLLKVDLTYLLAHDTVVIASEDEAIEWPLIGIYPVGDLLKVKQDDTFPSKTEGVPTYPEDIAHLKQIVEATCCVDDWANGDAYIVEMQPSLLIVRHREEVHDEIQDLLSALRLAKQHQFAMPLEHHEDNNQPEADSNSKAKSTESVGDMGGGGMF